MIKRKSDYFINKLGDGSSIQITIDVEYRSFIENRPYILNIIVQTYKNATTIHINFDPRYDKDEALVQLEKDLNDEILKRATKQIDNLEFIINFSPRLKEAFSSPPKNIDLNEDIF